MADTVLTINDDSTVIAVSGADLLASLVAAVEADLAVLVTAAETAEANAETAAALATTNGAAQVALATTQANLATTNGAAQVALATTQAGLATAAAATSGSAREADQALTNLRNLFDQTRATDEVLILSSTGATSAQAGFFVTNYIPVQPGSQFIVNRISFGNGSASGRAYYDANLTFVSGDNANIAANTAITVPATTSIRFVRFTVQTLSNKRGMTVTRGAAVPTAYRSFEADDKLSAHKAALLRDQAQFGDINLFDPSRITASVLLNSTTGATEASSATRYATDFIPVIEGGSIIFSQANGLSANYGIAFYDINRLYLSGIAGGIAAATPYTVPFGAAYARSGWDTAGAAPAPTAFLGIYNSATLPIFRKFGRTTSTEATALDEAYYRSFAPKYVNLFDYDEIATSTLLSSVTGVVSAAASNLAATKLMRCTPGGSVIQSANGIVTSTNGIAFYDAAGKFVSGIASPITAGAAQAVPATAYFWRTNVTTALAPTFYAGEGTTLPPGSYIAPWGAGYEQDKRLAGVLAAMSGDSIVAENNVWPSALAFVRATYSQNWGVNGSVMGDVLTGRVSGDFTNIGLYGVSTGTNDWTAQTAIGAIGDAAGAASFIGKTKQVIETVLGWKPSLDMFLVTPLHRETEYSAGLAIPLASYVDAMISVAALYGVPVIDQYRRSMVGPQTFATYLRDGLHPSITGGPIIGRRWGRELERTFG